MRPQPIDIMGIFGDGLLQALPNLAMPAIAVIALMVLAAVAKRFRPWIKGAAGERLVNRTVKSMGLRIAHDVYLPHTGKATQVDHLVLAGSTIVVLETKNWDGAVYGRAEDSHWNVAYGRKNNKRTLNPIVQNAIHTKAVRTVAGEGAEIVGMVVSVGRTKFPNGRPKGLCDISQLKTALKRLKGPTSREAEAAWRRLTAVHSEDRREMRKAHSERIRDHNALNQKREPKRSAAGKVVDARQGRIEPTL